MAKLKKLSPPDHLTNNAALDEAESGFDVTSDRMILFADVIHADRSRGFGIEDRVDLRECGFAGRFRSRRDRCTCGARWTAVEVGDLHQDMKDLLDRITLGQ